MLLVTLLLLETLLVTVRALLSAGAQVDLARADTGASPLWMACQAGHVDVIRTLLASGARLGLQALDGRSALDACTPERRATLMWELDQQRKSEQSEIQELRLQLERVQGEKLGLEQQLEHEMLGLRLQLEREQREKQELRLQLERVQGEKLGMEQQLERMKLPSCRGEAS